MKMKFLAATAAVALVAAAPTAHAATYISQMDFSQGSGGGIAENGSGTVVTPYGTFNNTFGTVIIREGGLSGGSFVDGQQTSGLFTTLDIQVYLATGYTFIDTAHDTSSSVAREPFTFNLVNSTGAVDSGLSVSANGTTAPKFAFVTDNADAGVTWSVDTASSGPGFGISQSPFPNFADGVSLSPDGGSNHGLSPLEFTITRTSGISFLGAGGDGHAADDVLTSTNSLPSPFNNGSGVWWFSSDVSNNGNTFTAAATLATQLVTVPEPAAWALMIMGFGGVGAMMRRRRVAIA